MSEQNKILDVTYGKFSCRLEGFDDAVETMKTVVSYFQDLAGAENFLEVARGIPDMDTLARLAEAQAGGTVTAEPLQGGVSLTREASEAAIPALADAAWDETEADILPEMPQDEAPDMDAQTAEDAQPAPEAQDHGADAIADTDEQDDAAPLELSGEDAGEAEEDFAAFDEIAEAEAEAEDETSIFAEDAADPDADTVTFDPEPVAETQFPEEAAAVAEDSAPETDDTSEVEGLRARLDRIRDLVSQGAKPAATAPEEPAAPSPLRPVGNPLTQRLAELAKRNSALMEADNRMLSPLPQEDAIADEAVEDSGVMETPEATEASLWEDRGAEEIADVAEAAPAMEPSVEADAEDEIFDDAPAMDASAVVEAEEAEEDSFDTAPAEEVAAEDAVAEDPEAAEVEDETPAPSAEDETADMAAADDRPVTRPTSDRPLLLTTPQRPAREDLTAEEEDDFDLSAELAEIEQEIASRPRNGVVKHGLPSRVEDAMSRIFEETNHQLDEPEGRRHRDALAQLKAAVAATEAARQLGDSTRSRDAGEDYRDDLGQLEAESRSTKSGMPPLKLVKTVELENPAAPQGRETSKLRDVAADRLRQIAATKDAEATDGKAEDFADFIERHGVSDLADKLEAAAAYLTFVDGEPDFTRPQLMRLVQSATHEEIAREDGLRCFGRLLRQSRFTKLNNGRFKVEENTPFRPRSSRRA